MKYQKDARNHFPTKNSHLTNPLDQVIKDKPNEDEDQDDDIFKFHICIRDLYLFDVQFKFVLVWCSTNFTNIMYFKLRIANIYKIQVYHIFKHVQIEG